MLDIRDISKTFNPGTVNEKTALSHLSLHLAPGDFAAIIGSNGAGKSTLLNAVAGSFYADEGSITLDGRDITFTPDHKRSKVIGRLFQDPLKGTAPSMTIEENLALAYLRSAHGKAPFSRITKKDKEYFAEKLKLLGMGLEDRMRQPVGLLSGGQRQALTRAGLADGDAGHPQAPPAGRAHRRPGPGHGGKGAGAYPHHHCGPPYHLPHGHPQHEAGAGAGQPHPDDGKRADCAGRFGQGTRRDDGGRPAAPLPGGDGARPGQ